MFQVNKKVFMQKNPNKNSPFSWIVDNVPESYKRIYNELKIEYDKIEPKYLENILKLSGLTCSIQQDILNLIHLNNNPLFVTQNTFNLFLALVALAQADMGKLLDKYMNLQLIVHCRYIIRISQ